MRPICALSTARMNCAIHIIRLSGDGTFDLLQKICAKPIRREGYTIQRNKIIDRSTGTTIDDVLLNVFVGPRSYTGEDLVEINCHGGVVVADKILSLLVSEGFFPAGRGEYTQRALLNQKLDWSQVEAVNNLVNARNEYSIRGSIGALTGKLSQQLQEMQTTLFKVLGQIEVNIDYPEFDDVPEMTLTKIGESLTKIVHEIQHLVTRSQKFLPLSQGINVAIVGAPNAGKSSLLNFLTQEEKAIVSPTPGTTRDVVESWVNIDGLTLHLLDTAGIRDTTDQIEQFGITKAYQTVQQADVVIYLREFGKTDSVHLNLRPDQHLISLVSKGDLWPNAPAPTISVKTGDIQALLDQLRHLFVEADFESSSLTVLQSKRQIDLLQQVKTRLQFVLDQIEQGTYVVDLVATDLQLCNTIFNDLLGKGENYDFLDELFANFCVGK